jgi:hypothetical protein
LFRHSSAFRSYISRQPVVIQDIQLDPTLVVLRCQKPYSELQPGSLCVSHTRRNSMSKAEPGFPGSQPVEQDPATTARGQRAGRAQGRGNSIGSGILPPARRTAEGLLRRRANRIEPADALGGRQTHPSSLVDRPHRVTCVRYADSIVAPQPKVVASPWTGSWQDRFQSLASYTLILWVALTTPPS